MVGLGLGLGLWGVDYCGEMLVDGLKEEAMRERAIMTVIIIA